MHTTRPLLTSTGLLMLLMLASMGLAEETLTVQDGTKTSRGGDGASATKVIEVTSARYDKLLRKEPLALLEVYSPECYHCQQLESAYAHAASVLADEAAPIPLARINIDTEKEFIEQKFPNIEGTPLLVVLREGREVERLKYGGQAGAVEGEKIITAMREIALAPHGSNEVKELSELSDLRVGKGLQGAIVVSKPIGEAMVVAVLEPPSATKNQDGLAKDNDDDKEDTAARPVKALFGSITRTMKQKIGFAHTYSDELRADLKVKKANMLLLLQAPYLAHGRDTSLLASLDLDEVVQRHTTGADVDLRTATEAVKDWILQNAKPPVGILTQRSFGSLYRLHRPLLVAFVEGDMHEPQATTTQFTEKARKHYTMLRKLVGDKTWKEDGLDELTVVMAEAKGFERHMSGLGLRPGTKSIGVGILAGEGETTLKYRLGYDSDVSKGSVRQFAQRFIDKEEPVYVWSEPLPTAEEQAELAPVVKAVGSTIDEVIYDSSVDVFVHVMHKQCSHCTAFMPTWKELAVSLADKPVRLVILDQRSNDVPKWFGGNPPMLLLIKKDHKQTDRPIMYSPGQQPTVEGMTEWLQSQGLDLSSSSRSSGPQEETGATETKDEKDAAQEARDKPPNSKKRNRSKKAKGTGKDEL